MNNEILNQLFSNLSSEAIDEIIEESMKLCVKPINDKVRTYHYVDKKELFNGNYYNQKILCCATGEVVFDFSSASNIFEVLEMIEDNKEYIEHKALQIANDFKNKQEEFYNSIRSFFNKLKNNDIIYIPKDLFLEVSIMDVSGSNTAGYFTICAYFRGYTLLSQRVLLKETSLYSEENLRNIILKNFKEYYVGRMKNLVHEVYPTLNKKLVLYIDDLGDKDYIISVQNKKLFISINEKILTDEESYNRIYSNLKGYLTDAKNNQYKEKAINNFLKQLFGEEDTVFSISTDLKNDYDLEKRLINITFDIKDKNKRQKFIEDIENTKIWRNK